jgi:hypothetical protein
MTLSLLARVDAWRRAQPGGEALPRSHAMRMLMELGLAGVEKRKPSKAKGTL